MKAVWKPALLFVFLLIITLLVNMPVQHLLARINMPSAVKVSQLQGNLLGGQVGTLMINQLIIRDLEYQVDGSCLLSASLCYQINFSGGSVSIRYLPVTGSTEVLQLDAELSISNLGGLADQWLFKPSGSLYLSSPRLLFTRGRLADIDAVVVWKEAGIAGEDINLGDYQLNLKKDVGQYRVDLSDKEAVLDVEGEGTLNSGGNYSLNINIKSSSALDARVKSALEFITSRKRLNQYQIRFSGISDKNLLSYISFENP
jgi:hypothetical protein